MSELDLLSWLRERVPGLDDDIAELTPLPEGGSWIVTSDHQIPGVHVPENTAPEVIAERLLRVNLSDIAAGGARPRFAFANVAAPADYPLQQFLVSLVDACEEFGVELKGGDTSSARQPVFSLTLMGELSANGKSPARSNAEPGDRLWLSGNVGESRLGREVLQIGIDRIPSGLRAAAEAAVERHLRPEPHLDLGEWLAEQPRAAAIDISDGLALDLHRLCEASGVGATLNGDSVPFADDHAALAAALDLDPLETALAGGEDYVLLFALPPEAQPPAEPTATQVGAITGGSEVLLRRAETTDVLQAQGWDHLAERDRGT